jgi:hypothetical protein
LADGTSALPLRLVAAPARVFGGKKSIFWQKSWKIDDFSQNFAKSCPIAESCLRETAVADRLRNRFS